MIHPYKNKFKKAILSTAPALLEASLFQDLKLFIAESPTTQNK